ncbi:papain-like cysteine protease family protein [Kutzneria albida]|uniref:Peptidase C39-like domain-containing protein n=1 Tax=Kutzneria albida DSM 43870 TaxID=1449976 RepID=W5W420_9PSEU|nr:papain-like cysteine protease family protein [Kutzneria albida]AHH95592.1 hypothetical protein KALB_2223 [Kutzneria albida DSM 43870]
MPKSPIPARRRRGLIAAGIGLLVATMPVAFALNANAQPAPDAALAAAHPADFTWPCWPGFPPFPGCATPTPTTSPAPTSTTQPTPGGAVVLKFSQLKQEQDQWCWDASGLSIARYLGYAKDVSQNSFCDYARGLADGAPCPNEPGEFSDVQKAYSRIGLGQGSVSSSALSFADVQTEINANRPIETGIYWTAGGGHAQVIYGYDPSTKKLSYGDPWPQSSTYNEMSYSSYVNNNQFRWAEALYRIGR